MSLGTILLVDTKMINEAESKASHDSRSFLVLSTILRLPVVPPPDVHDGSSAQHASSAVERAKRC